MKSASERKALAIASLCNCPFESNVPSSVKSVSGVSSPCFRFEHSSMSSTSDTLAFERFESFPIKRYSLTVTG